jgi:hypothetical protein
VRKRSPGEGSEASLVLCDSFLLPGFNPSPTFLRIPDPRFFLENGVVCTGEKEDQISIGVFSQALNSHLLSERSLLNLSD